MRRMAPLPSRQETEDIALGQPAPQSVAWRAAVFSQPKQESRQRGSRNESYQDRGSALQFEFLTSMGPPGKARGDQVSRKLVRVHAMRSFLHAKKLATV